MKIQEIRDIVRILEKYLDSGHLLAFSPSLDKENTKLAKFHNFILNSSIKTDKEIAEQIFGKDFSKTKYKTLKAYYLSSIINKIPFLKISKSELSVHSKAIYKSQKLLFYVRTLLFLGARAGATHFAKRLSKLAEKFEMYSVSIALLDEFRRNSMQLGDKKGYSKYLRESIKQTDLLVSESKMKALEEQVLIHSSNSLFVEEKFKSEVRLSLRKAKLILGKHETYFNRLSYYRIDYICHQLDNTPLKSIAACEGALQYMATKPHMSPDSRFGEFALYKLENYILLRDYEKGKETAEYCEKYIHRGMNLWFSFKEYHFLLMMQTMAFEEAGII